ncbi:isoprenylcysteine carboxylmethyltransferase family protein [Pseudidiomarina sp. 1APP75-27a]|uniref:methyltransferase family protein n=1 Tax=Pseudidiomarina terrestris TaxID=2820060 RepID=UPI002B054556|nr:isoprenylcysteine carboxylmethyltransferase family protein [Pseudidiomarina sp. 1APP75-27a]MEA3589094.1 isoprenylcysteine carboxylmethyltransferase family protein [Pseudidiomarina sp. 1APP75-27a]
MNRLELKIPPVVVVLLITLAMYLTDKLVQWPLVSYPQFATTLSVIGLAVAVLGVWQFRRAHTTVDPRAPQASSQLVTGGIYRWTRNPMYLGFLLVLAGFATKWGNLAVVPWLIVYVLYMNRFQIVPEERILSAKFGTPYKKYLKQVRRWF